MSVETKVDQAFIDHPSLRLKSVEVGDIVGECGGVVDALEKEGVLVSVLPDHFTCGRCLFSEYCTSSKAD